MLPSHIKMEWIDPKIRALVININRVPEVHTMTTCQSHPEYAIPMWPTKDGWIHFSRPNGTHENLVSGIQDFCEGIEFFSVTEGWDLNNGRTLHTISGDYEPHTDDEGMPAFVDWPEKDQQAYLARAKLREKEIFKGWFEINRIVMSYLRDNVSADFKKLPYRFE